MKKNIMKILFSSVLALILNAGFAVNCFASEVSGLVGEMSTTSITLLMGAVVLLFVVFFISLITLFVVVKKTK